jgi:hypothetical protein
MQSTTERHAAEPKVLPLWSLREPIVVPMVQITNSNHRRPSWFESFERLLQWIVGSVSTLIALRFLLVALGANREAPFVKW